MKESHFRGGYRLELERFDHGWLPLAELRRVQEGARTFYESPAAVGCALALSRQLYDALWGFDPHMYQWGVEDLDLSLKCWLSGRRILHDPKAVVGHGFRATFDSYDTALDHFLANQLRAAWKNFTPGVWKEWLDRAQQRYQGHHSEHVEGLWARVWAMFLEGRASADAERAHLHARRTRDEFWYAERFGLSWPRLLAAGEKSRGGQSSLFHSPPPDPASDDRDDDSYSSSTNPSAAPEPNDEADTGAPAGDATSPVAPEAGAPCDCKTFADRVTQATNDSATANRKASAKKAIFEELDKAVEDLYDSGVIKRWADQNFFAGKLQAKAFEITTAQHDANASWQVLAGLVKAVRTKYESLINNTNMLYLNLNRAAAKERKAVLEWKEIAAEIRHYKYWYDKNIAPSDTVLQACADLQRRLHAQEALCKNLGKFIKDGTEAVNKELQPRPPCNDGILDLLRTALQCDAACDGIKPPAFKLRGAGQLVGLASQVVEMTESAEGVINDKATGISAAAAKRDAVWQAYCAADAEATAAGQNLTCATKQYEHCKGDPNCAPGPRPPVPKVSCDSEDAAARTTATRLENASKERMNLAVALRNCLSGLKGKCAADGKGGWVPIGYDQLAVATAPLESAANKVKLTTSDFKKRLSECKIERTQWLAWGGELLWDMTVIADVAFGTKLTFVAFVELMKHSIDAGRTMNEVDDKLDAVAKLRDFPVDVFDNMASAIERLADVWDPPKQGGAGRDLVSAKFNTYVKNAASMATISSEMSVTSLEPPYPVALVTRWQEAVAGWWTKQTGEWTAAQKLADCTARQKALGAVQ